MPERLELHLLGGVSLILDGRYLTTLRSRKDIALLIYLACTERAHNREVLADLLWEATSTAQALSDLRTVLARLRPHLGPYLLVTSETIALAPGAPLWLDVNTLEQQLATLPRHLSPEVFVQVDQTLALYQGDFLAGFHVDGAPRFDDWALVERERLRFRVLDALHRLTAHCIRTDNFTMGLRITTRLLTLDPLDEGAHAQHMRLLTACGQRAAALAHDKAYCQIALAELGVEPDETLQALYTQIRDGVLTSPITPAEDTKPQLAPGHNLPELPNAFMGRVRTLATIQARLRDPAVLLVTLAGEGGVGKSRLALAVGQQMVGAWPDGVWFVPLAGVAADPPPTLPDRLATAVAAAIGLSTSTRLPTRAASRSRAPSRLSMINWATSSVATSIWDPMSGRSVAVSVRSTRLTSAAA